MEKLQSDPLLVEAGVVVSPVVLVLGLTVNVFVQAVIPKPLIVEEFPVMNIAALNAVNL